MSLMHFEADLNEVNTLDQLESFRIAYLGKSGKLTLALKELGSLTPDEKKIRGAELNTIRDHINNALSLKKESLESDALEQTLKDDAVDVTLDGTPYTKGKIHILTQVMDDVRQYFYKRGFTVNEGPDVDTEEYNFDALNIPSHHPARQNHDTFYLDQPGYLLRTHTSNVQIHSMKKMTPPFRIMSMGRAYRSDDIDATHTPMFHQIEGLVLDKNIHFGHLKSTIIDFCRDFFNIPNLEVRFRPSFFPFTEPSAEVDIRCSRKGGVLELGKGDDWLEILGCGMVHPNVLTHCGIDPNEYQGFAFGMGVERLTMLRYGISDIRNFYESDNRFLNHFGAIA
jgi:phenylalanyl-tRNA synthetase alpha chain